MKKKKREREYTGLTPKYIYVLNITRHDDFIPIQEQGYFWLIIRWGFSSV